jgi:hypothetical protein
MPDLKVIIQRNPANAGLYISESAIDFGIYKHTDSAVVQTLAIANHQDFFSNCVRYID